MPLNCVLTRSRSFLNVFETVDVYDSHFETIAPELHENSERRLQLPGDARLVVGGCTISVTDLSSIDGSN